MASIFTYGFQDAIDNFRQSECKYISLCDYETLLTEAVNAQFIQAKNLEFYDQIKRNLLKNPKFSL